MAVAFSGCARGGVVRLFSKLPGNVDEEGCFVSLKFVVCDLYGVYAREIYKGVLASCLRLWNPFDVCWVWGLYEFFELRVHELLRYNKQLNRFFRFFVLLCLLGLISIWLFVILCWCIFRYNFLGLGHKYFLLIVFLFCLLQLGLGYKQLRKRNMIKKKESRSLEEIGKKVLCYIQFFSRYFTSYYF